MYQIVFENNESIHLDVNISENQLLFTINNQTHIAEIQQVHPYEYYIKYNNRTYNILLLSFNPQEKKVTLKINGKRTTVQLKDKYDLLLHQLGLDKIKNNKADSIKAPMPGMVLDIMVSEGQQVKKGDAILVLEAMKMENVLKATSDGIVKKIVVKKGSAVEKNQLLIEF